MPNNEKQQIARIIFHKWLSNMKFALDLEEFSYKDKGRNDPRFKFFKKQLMANTYDSLRELFAELENLELIEKTDYNEDVKDGYKDSLSGGSGYVNTDLLNDILE